MLTKVKILEIAKKKGQFRSRDLTTAFGVSRQYVNLLVLELLRDKKLVRIGSTRNAFYILPEFAKTHPELNDELNRRAWFATLPYFTQKPAAFNLIAWKIFIAFMKKNELIQTEQPIENYTVNLDIQKE